MAQNPYELRYIVNRRKEGKPANFITSYLIKYIRLTDFQVFVHFLARDALLQNAKRGIAIACGMSSVCLSVSLVDLDQDHIRCKSWKLIARTSSPTPSLFVAQRPPTYSEGNMGKFGGD